MSKSKAKDAPEWTSIRVRPAVLPAIDSVNMQRLKLGLPKLSRGQLIQTLMFEEMQRLAARIEDGPTIN